MTNEQLSFKENMMRMNQQNVHRTTRECICFPSFQKLSLYDAMFTALVQDRVDFVQLFLENGVNMKKFLSIETLWNLYGNVSGCNPEQYICIYQSPLA